MITLVVYAGKIDPVHKVFLTRLISLWFACLTDGLPVRAANFASRRCPDRARGFRFGHERWRHESESFD